MSGQKIIDGLKDAVADNLSRVTIEGQTWVRLDAISADSALNILLKRVNYDGDPSSLTVAEFRRAITADQQPGGKA